MATTRKSLDGTKRKAQPSPSARPIIVGHEPIVRDPMVKTEEVSEEAVAAVPSASKRVIKPLDASEKPGEEPSSTDEQTDAQKEEAKDAAVVDAVAEQADLNKKKADGPTDEDLKKQEEIEKVIASKKYAVSIGQVSRRRNKRALVTVVMLLVLLAAFYFAADTGFVSLPFDLPIDLIKT